MADHRAFDPLVQSNAVPDAGERMQRLRVGLTGLAAVLLVVILATAIASAVRRNAAEGMNVVAPPAVVATLPPADNAAALNTEPLAQLGAAPGGKPGPVTQQPPAKH
jgi:hypothetical protein